MLYSSLENFLFKIYFIFILYVRVFCLLCMYVYIPCACSAVETTGYVSYPLGLELQSVWSFHVGTGNQT